MYVHTTVYALTLSHTRTDLRSLCSDYFIQENQPTCKTSWLNMIIPCRQSHKLALLWETITLNWMDSVPWPTMSGRQSIHDCFVLSGGVVVGALGGWLFSEFHMAYLDFQTAHQCATKLGLRNTALQDSIPSPPGGDWRPFLCYISLCKPKWASLFKCKWLLTPPVLCITVVGATLFDIHWNKTL